MSMVLRILCYEVPVKLNGTYRENRDAASAVRVLRFTLVSSTFIWTIAFLVIFLPVLTEPFVQPKVIREEGVGSKKPVMIV